MITIHGRRWRLIKKRLAGCWGRCDFPQRVIYLDPSLTGFELCNVLLHEVQHAYDCESEEHRVQSVAAAYAQAMKELRLIPPEDSEV